LSVTKEAPKKAVAFLKKRLPAWGSAKDFCS